MGIKHYVFGTFQTETPASIYVCQCFRLVITCSYYFTKHLPLHFFVQINKRWINFDILLNWKKIVFTAKWTYVCIVCKMLILCIRKPLNASWSSHDRYFWTRKKAGLRNGIHNLDQSMCFWNARSLMTEMYYT